MQQVTGLGSEPVVNMRQNNENNRYVYTNVDEKVLNETDSGTGHKEQEPLDMIVAKRANKHPRH